MEVFEIRSREKSLILCSQMTSVEWHKKLGGGAIADALLDCDVSKLNKITGTNRPICMVLKNAIYMVP